ncbi:hypothetical protein ACHAXN_009715 [Cyclotella atomus]
MCRINGFYLAIATILLCNSVVSGQTFKAFERYRKYFPDLTSRDEDHVDTIDLDARSESNIPQPNEKVSDGHIYMLKENDLDLESIASSDSLNAQSKPTEKLGYSNDKKKSSSPPKQSARKLAYNNHHRNQIKILDPDQPLLPPTETTLTTGLFHTCAITKRAGTEECSSACGPVKCWGNNDKGQSSPPHGVVFTQISAGGYFTCGLEADREVICWGEIDKLRPHDHIMDESKPKPKETYSGERHKRRLDKSEYKAEIERRKKRSNVEESYAEEAKQSVIFFPTGTGEYIQISSGMKHACALARDLTVHCWGRNDFGEGSPPRKKFVQIAAGNSVTCGLDSNGTAECWGRNPIHQTTPQDKIFQQISSSSLGHHICGVEADNSIYCWGDNIRGQTDPQEGSFLQVTTGYRTTCGIRDSDDASIHCWGARANELLHHINRGTKAANNNDSTKSHFHQVSLGKDHACAVSTIDSEDPASSTSIQCWWLGGSNYDAHKVPPMLVVVV